MFFQKMHLLIKIHKTTYTICETNKCIEIVLFLMIIIGRLGQFIAILYQLKSF